MKIWFPAVTGGSGTDVFTSRLAKALQRRGVEAEITWFPTHYQFVPQLLRSIRPPAGTDIVHVNAWNGFAFKRAGLPLVVTEHQGVFGTGNRPYRSAWQTLYHLAVIRPYVRASLHAATAVTVVSCYAADGLKRTLAYQLAQPIYNFVDCDEFVPGSPLPQTGPFRLLFVGNWSSLKGSEVLMAVMRQLGPTFQLRFTSGLKDLRPSTITNNMIPLGRLTRREDIAREYQNCDAVIVPSFFEGFGYVALEGMACGKPVIASNNSAIPEVVEDQVTGILCPTGDVEAFTAACRYMAENRDVAQRYGDAGRERALSVFSENIIVPRYIALYERLLAGRHD